MSGGTVYGPHLPHNAHTPVNVQLCVCLRMRVHVCMLASMYVLRTKVHTIWMKVDHNLIRREHQVLLHTHTHTHTHTPCNQITEECVQCTTTSVQRDVYGSTHTQPCKHTHTCNRTAWKRVKGSQKRFSLRHVTRALCVWFADC